MSCVESHLDESGVRKTRWHCGPMRRDQIALYHRTPRVGLALLCLLIASGGASQSAAHEIDFTPYARAADHCRGDVARPIALSQDKRVLCLDGTITSDLNVAVAADLADRGIAVVRSAGGDPASAVRLANTLRDRNAAVVVRNFCLYACASFILLASSEAYVLDGALVAWGLFRRYLDQDCIGFMEGKDGAGAFLTWLSCSPDYLDERPRSRLWTEFYRDRIVETAYTDPPESKFIRRELMNLYRSTGQYPLVLWTWNPRYQLSAVKTKLVYQHYPESQEEVDAIAERLGLKRRVIYDP